ncbi:peptidase C39 family protein [Microbacterium sp. NPDC076911]|uniref:peptidase C39 family protein n=1 Tax=Microbacterium sp. NPDC076911 TaxID=3154958 RepID=UPI00343F3739
MFDTLLVPADEVALAEVAELISGTRADRWRIDRSLYRPELGVIRDRDGALTAAVLTTARPATAATKIVDLWYVDAVAGEALLDAVVDLARWRDDVAVKWELPEGVAEPSFATMFTPMRQPWAAVGTEFVRGLVLWLRHVEHTEPGYYAQTTLFTCGAVAALIAADAFGHGALSGDAGDREREIEFWRRASNYPACEPVGLAVALREHLGDVPIEVALDHDGPVLLEDVSGFDYDFRAELQAESWRQAAALGVPLRRDRVSIEEILRRVEAGELALLLIDEAPMHGETGPHWITAHAASNGIVLLQDPWVTVAAGETWVDTHDMPMRSAELEQLVRWSDENYRGVIFTGKRPSV